MIINGINTCDISFVIQGAVDPVITPKCISSIRKNFPDSEIILSTWRGTFIDNYDFDKLILSDDPGAVICDFNSIPNNVNRQILSSYAGLKEVKRKYAAKVRSDLIFDDFRFLEYFEKFEKYNNKYKCVKARMIALSLYTRLFYINYENLNINLANFHVSDWFMFGYTDDVLRYFSVQMIDDLAEYSRYYLDKKECHIKLPYPHLMSKLTPEQYMFSNFCDQTDKNTIVDIAEYDKEEALKYLINNFVILDYEHSHIHSEKWRERSMNEWSMHPFEVASLIFYADFLKYYKRYCDKDYLIENKIDAIVYRRKIKVLWEVIWYDKARNFVRKKVNIVRSRLEFIVKFVRKINFSYRATCITRDLLRIMEKEQEKNFFELYEQVEKNNKMIKQVKRAYEKEKIKRNSEGRSDDFCSI